MSRRGSLLTVYFFSLRTLYAFLLHCLCRESPNTFIASSAVYSGKVPVVWLW